MAFKIPSSSVSTSSEGCSSQFSGTRDLTGFELQLPEDQYTVPVSTSPEEYSSQFSGTRDHNFLTGFEQHGPYKKIERPKRKSTMSHIQVQLREDQSTASVSTSPEEYSSQFSGTRDHNFLTGFEQHGPYKKIERPKRKSTMSHVQIQLREDQPTTSVSTSPEEYSSQFSGSRDHNFMTGFEQHGPCKKIERPKRNELSTMSHIPVQLRKDQYTGKGFHTSNELCSDNAEVSSATSRSESLDSNFLQPKDVGEKSDSGLIRGLLQEQKVGQSKDKLDIQKIRAISPSQSEQMDYNGSGHRRNYSRDFAMLKRMEELGYDPPTMIAKLEHGISKCQTNKMKLNRAETDSKQKLSRMAKEVAIERQLLKDKLLQLKKQNYLKEKERSIQDVGQMSYEEKLKLETERHESKIEIMQLQLEIENFDMNENKGIERLKTEYKIIKSSLNEIEIKLSVAHEKIFFLKNIEKWTDKIRHQT